MVVLNIRFDKRIEVAHNLIDFVAIVPKKEVFLITYN